MTPQKQNITKLRALNQSMVFDSYISISTRHKVEQQLTKAIEQGNSCIEISIPQTVLTVGEYYNKYLKNKTYDLSNQDPCCPVYNRCSI